MRTTVSNLRSINRRSHLCRNEHWPLAANKGQDEMITSARVIDEAVRATAKLIVDVEMGVAVNRAQGAEIVELPRF